MGKKLIGQTASAGIAMGLARLFIKKKINLVRRDISEKETQTEIQKLEQAIADYEKVLKNLIPRNETEKAIFEMHVELLNDPYFYKSAVHRIEKEKVDAIWAVHKTVLEMASIIDALEDPYLRSRGEDYRDIGMNVIRHLAGDHSNLMKTLEEDAILITKDLTPSDFTLIDSSHFKGFIDEHGSRMSHVSILAQNMNIPGMVSVKNALEEIHEGDFLILDANKGFVYVNPDQEKIEAYQQALIKSAEKKNYFAQIKDQIPMTKDGKSVRVSANVGNYSEVVLGIQEGCNGVGLFRTECLYLNHQSFPAELEQFNVYKKAAEKLGGKDLLIRTLDIGGDKDLPYFKMPEEDNPFLGLRALRICFRIPDIFRTQIRAILKASHYGKIKILLPMVVSMDELMEAKRRIEACKEELRKEGIPFDENIPIGIMVETPAAILMADELAKASDFFSIGTNDLTQYILAADRGNALLSELYNSYDPSVLKAIQASIDAAHANKIECGLCGAFAGDIRSTFLLLGMGIDELSVPSSRIGPVKKIIMESDYTEAQRFAREILAASSLSEVASKLKGDYKKTAGSPSCQRTC